MLLILGTERLPPSSSGEVPYGAVFRKVKTLRYIYPEQTSVSLLGYLQAIIVTKDSPRSMFQSLSDDPGS